MLIRKSSYSTLFLTIILSALNLTGCSKKKPQTITQVSTPSTNLIVSAEQKTVVENSKATEQTANHIEFVDPIPDTEVDFAFPIRIRALDSNNKVIPGFNEKVLISIEKTPEEGSEDFASGPNFTSFKDGEAIINTLTIDIPGQGYILKASTTNLSVLSKPFNILPLQPKEVTLILNGKKRKVKFEPPNVLIDPEGDRMPVFDKNITEFSTLGKHYKIKIVSPTEVIVDETVQVLRKSK